MKLARQVSPNFKVDYGVCRVLSCSDGDLRSIRGSCGRRVSVRLAGQTRVDARQSSRRHFRLSARYMDGP